MRFSNKSTGFCVALLLIALINTTNAETRQTRTPARVLAKQTGATQFEEERFEAHTDCNDHKHHLKKRASDEDVDYEVYQGVVGRPGIDFPIYPRIPKTSFSCRSFGNGYFADMDTDCQVFHICEEGRKISFLCPNGTIFQQSELTCDWWFKVNCLGSPGYYAESAEILSKQRSQRLRPSVPVKGFNIVGGGLNIKPKINNTPTPRRNNKSERRIDSSEQQPSVETVDFEDISGEKHLKSIDNNSNDNNESQITAESSSFVSGRSRNSYNYEKPNGDGSTRQQKNQDNAEKKSSKDAASKTGTQKPYSNPANTNTESSERARNGHRGQQRFEKERNTGFELNGSAEGVERKSVGSQKKSVLPEKVIGVEVNGRNNNFKDDITAEPDAKPEYYDAAKRATERTPTASTTQYQNQGSYSTARKLDNTRTTPYYTPTVPSVGKSKTTESKTYYVKGKIGGSSGNVGGVATTPNPNRLNGGSPASGFYITSSGAAKTTTAAYDSNASTLGTTFKPFIIGMRHNNEHDPSSAEVHRLSLGTNKPFNVAELAVDNKPKNKKTETREYLPTTTTPATTGPTYLPKNSAKSPKNSAAAAGDDLLLFAPNPVADDTVSRNLDEMLKAMNLLKSKLSDAEENKASARAGLEIPPSSGPDVLISLAKYFAGEQGNGNSNALTETDSKKSNEKQGVNTHSAASKPSDTTATLTTAATPRVAVKASDIKDSLLSERTVDRYTSLFGLNGDFKLKTLNLQADEKLNKSAAPTQATIKTPFPQIGSTDSTIRELAQKPETRRIAQTFSNALTNYLEDPKTFRQQLQSVRPTEPPTAAVESIKPNFVPVTSKENLLFKSGTAASYLPTKPTSPIKLEASSAASTTQRNIAVEINDNFDFSTQLPSTTDPIDTTTYRPAYKPFDKKPQLELSAELAPLSPDSAEGEEFLQRQQTQSFVKSRNEFASNGRGVAKKTGKASGAYVSAAKTTENPWNSISQTVYLDPLTINDGLMKETRTTTINPNTYLPKETTTTPRFTTVRGKLQELPTKSTNNQARNFGSRFSVGSAEVTTQRNNRYQNLQETDSWRDILNTYDLPLDTLPSSNGLQRIANRLFGGLNESEALHLKNVMQQAEHNRQVLRLLLLLIQTCDDQNGKALERSRKHLLNALIDMDSKLQATHDGKLTHQKGGKPATITTTISPNSNSRNDDGTTTINPPTTTDLPLTTPTVATRTTTSSGSFEETTKFEIRVADPEEDQISTASTLVANTHTSSDQRALELLKSLYSLASKFTSRR